MTESRRIDQPSPGFFALRLVRGGPLVPARIYRPCPMVPPSADVMPGGWHHQDAEPGDAHPDDWCTPSDRSRGLVAEIQGSPASLWRVWMSRPITRADFDYMTAVADYAKTYAPHMPQARSLQAVDLRTQPSLF